ncbi:hypothetical protein bcgnr5406_55550 [Bacillus cereus]|nr:hypothetical protein BCM0075_1258 [Bacillus cereus]
MDFITYRNLNEEITRRRDARIARGIYRIEAQASNSTHLIPFNTKRMG